MISEIGLLHSVDTGTGRPIVFLHGFPLNHTMWQHQIEAFRHSYRVIAPDLRGFGKSAIDAQAAESGVAMAEYADDVARLLDHLEITEPVVLVGFSMGGYIAWKFFASFPTQVAAMILCDTRAADDTDEARRTRIKMADNVETWGSDHIARMMSPALVAETTTDNQPEVVTQLRAMISGTSPVAIAAAQRGMSVRDDSTSLLPSIEVPALFVAGVSDAISTPQEMSDMASSVPQGEFKVIPAAGHMSPMENPAAVNQAIQEFLDKLPE